MEYLDARRLTGPNLVWDRPGSIVDIGCTPDEVAALVPVWQQQVRQMLDAVGWQSEATSHRVLRAGVSLAISAPLDALYAAAEINEWAWSASVAQLSGGEAEEFAAASARIRAAIDAEVQPLLLALNDAAEEYGVAFLCDDDEISLGLGRGSQTWPVTMLPRVNQVDWGGLHNIPVGLVTGTNGKTTSVRLASHIVRAAGLNVGLSSTDWIGVNDTIVERGDYSGPGGARAVLRQQQVDIAILETARGGLLRRGMGVRHADAALITNIAEDHLGDFGSQSLDELLAIKWVVTTVLDQRGYLILNADDELLVAKSLESSAPIVWFSLDEYNPVIERHMQNGGKAFALRGDELSYFDGQAWTGFCSSISLPITLGGAAKHNVANALGAAALTHALGIPLPDIAQGLQSMSANDNPGRCNLFEIDGYTVLLDFAHNPQGMRALFEFAATLPAKRRLLTFGQAGDRTDALIQDLAREAWSTGLDQVLVSELAEYYRGREPGEVYALIRETLLQVGAQAEQIEHFELESAALEHALAWAEPGDLIIMLALAEAEQVLERLRTLAG